MKSVEGEGLTREIDGQVEEVTHVLTENPFTVVETRRVSEPADVGN